MESKKLERINGLVHSFNENTDSLSNEVGQNILLEIF